MKYFNEGIDQLYFKVIIKVAREFHVCVLSNILLSRSFSRFRSQKSEEGERIVCAMYVIHS